MFTDECSYTKCFYYICIVNDLLYEERKIKEMKVKKKDIFCPSSIVRDDCGYSAVLTCIHNLCFEQNYENSKKKNQLEIVIFTAVKYRYLLHGNVCVM